MRHFNHPLATSSWDSKEIEAMHRVIDEGFFTMGKYVASFESNFAKYIGSKYAVMVNSGSSANLLMIAAMFYTKEPLLKKGDEVIVPAVSWSTTYFPLYQYGLKLRFVDININTLNYDIDKLHGSITKDTKLIMAVNLLGNPNEFDKIKKISTSRNITLVEDNCESMGSEFESKKTGTFGLMGSFSSFFSHHISTMEGGLVVTDNEEIYQILLSLRAHGWTRNLPERNLLCKKNSSNSFEESFRFILPGYNLRPLEISGAIGNEQLKKLPAIISERRKNAQYFKLKMGDHSELMIQEEVGASSWFGFSLVIRPESNWNRSKLLEKLNQVGFECRPIVGGNFVKNDVIKYFDYKIHGSLDASNYIDMNGLFIGNHHYPIEEAIDNLTEINI